MSWQLATFALLAALVVGGFVAYERSRPTARLVALVAALAGLAVAGRLLFAPVPNVVATTDIALISGYALGGPAGFAVGALVAPISNIWLGQGPWTLWQTGAWGLCGLAGAGLAALMGGRTPGRWALAVACAAAGLVYGAIMDLSTMVNYGGEQSLDRYLALSARGLPFNLAHALGNLAIALAAGPALVRMISRFRARFAFRWRPAGALGCALAAAAGLALAAGPAGTAGPELARAQDLARAGASADARTWLIRHQNRDGGFAATPGTRSSPAMTGWAMLALEAAGRNPLDVRKRGNSPVDFLRGRVSALRSVGDLERTILALDGAGVDPRAFAGANLVAQLRERRGRDGSVNGQVNMTAFYVLAMRAAGEDDLGRSGRWLRRAQNRDGGWGFQPGARSDADSTGAALQALAAAGSGGPTSKAGVRWLRRAQRGNGGWTLAGGGAINAQSTAWAVQGLVAAGAGGEPLSKGLDFLAALRDADGHYSYSQASDQTPIWVTSQVLLAVEREPLPLPAAPRRRSSPGGSGGSGSGSAPSQAPAPAGGFSTPGFGAGGGAASGARSGAGAASRRGPGGSGPTRSPKGAAAQAGGTTLWQALLDEALRNGAERAPDGEAAQPGEAEYEPAAAVEDEPVAPYVAAGLAALAIALAVGFLWYRRQLP